MSKSVEIKNFRIDSFKNFLDENLMVDKNIMLEFTPSMVASCSFSSTDTFMKFWTLPLANLISTEKNDKTPIDLDELDNETPKFDFEKFDVYVLRGDLFKRYLSVFSGTIADIEFVMSDTNESIAAELIIKGKTENQNSITANFKLTSEDLITNKVEDYDKVIKQVTPNDSMYEFNLTDNQINEVKRLIRMLHKSVANNSAFVTFSIDSNNEMIRISDKVFNLEFPLQSLNENNKPKEDFEFKILKSDLVMCGKHTYSFHTNNNDDAVIMQTNYNKCLIACLSSKVVESSIEIDDSVLNESLNAVDIDDYFN